MSLQSMRPLFQVALDRKAGAGHLAGRGNIDRLGRQMALRGIGLTVIVCPTTGGKPVETSVRGICIRLAMHGGFAVNVAQDMSVGAWRRQARGCFLAPPAGKGAGGMHGGRTAQNAAHALDARMNGAR